MSESERTAIETGGYPELLAYIERLEARVDDQALTIGMLRNEIGGLKLRLAETEQRGTRAQRALRAIDTRLHSEMDAGVCVKLYDSNGNERDAYAVSKRTLSQMCRAAVYYGGASVEEVTA